MKKIILGLSFLAIAATTTFVACKKDEKSVQTSQKNNGTSNLLRDGKSVVIVAWDEWGRKKKDCKGNGLCKAVWFPLTDEDQSSSYAHSTTLEFDEVLGKYFVKLLRESSVGNPVPLEILTLPIDEPILLNTQAVLGQNLTFPIGEYPYIANLGLYGGYKVYLD
jgi:hypothetical protein